MRCRALLFSLTFLLTGSPALATDMTQATADVSPELVRLVSKQRIPDLSWEEVPASVESMRVGGESLPVARFKGTVPSLRGGNLLYSVNGQMKVAKVNEDDASVEIFVPLTQGRVPVRIRAVDDYGQIYDESLEVASSISEYASGKKLNFDIGTGVSYLAYSEVFRSQRFEITELGLTLKGGVNYQLSEKWEIGGNAFITALPLTLSRTPEGLEPSRWFGVNGRVGYRLFQPSPRASYHLMAGWYIWGMITPIPAPQFIYGVERLGGPQIFFTGRFRTESKRLAYAYLKFATIQDGGIFSTSNRELAVGGGYQISPPRDGSRRWMLTLDIANAEFQRTDQSFTLNSFSLGVSTNF